MQNPTHTDWEVEDQMTTSSPPWLDLPAEITAEILHKLGALEMLMTAQRVCKAWHRVCQDPSMWRSITMRKRDYRRSVEKLRRRDLEKLCRHAVDRSQGQLIDISIQGFGSDELMLYISQSCSQLRRLKLIRSLNIKFCRDLTSYGLIQAVENFHLLEELHLYHPGIDLKAIEAIGRSCPLLKSFTRCMYNLDLVVCDMEARAIAQNMPELRHLKLIGNGTTKRGLQGILHGCPHLVSLDLRQCFRIRFGEGIDRRIRDLKLPRYDEDDDDDDETSDTREFFNDGDSETSDTSSDDDGETSDTSDDDDLEISDTSSDDDSETFDISSDDDDDDDGDSETSDTSSDTSDDDGDSETSNTSSDDDETSDTSDDDDSETSDTSSDDDDDDDDETSDTSDDDDDDDDDMDITYDSDVGERPPII